MHSSANAFRSLPKKIDFFSLDAAQVRPRRHAFAAAPAKTWQLGRCGGCGGGGRRRAGAESKCATLLPICFCRSDPLFTLQ